MSTTPADAELLDLLLAEEGVEAGPRLTRRARGAAAVLSPAQQRLWFLQQLEPASAAYNITTAVRWRGRLEAAALEAALNDVVARHEVLRTAFPAEDGRAVVRVLPELKVSVQWRERAAANDPTDAHRPFDLATAPLLRLGVARNGAEEALVTLTVHHIVADAWSMEVFVRELGEAYVARQQGRAPAWTELSIQYADFAAWQRAWLETGVRAAQLDYWRRRLAQPPALELPTDRPRSTRADSAGAAHGFVLPGDVVEGVRRLAREEEATTFMVLLAAFQALLHRYTSQDDIVVGAPVANRTRREIEPLIGFFVNTLVLRANFSGHPDFRSLLRQVKRSAIDAYAHQDVPFEDLVQELQPDRRLSQNPLFSAMFSVQGAARETLATPGATLELLKPETHVAKFDLLVACEESASGIAGGIEYRTALFDPETIARWAAHFVELLRDAVIRPEAPVRHLRLLPESERRRMLEEWNATARPYPARGLAELFAEQAATTPTACAVKAGGATLTYAELDQRANRLAHLLAENGVGPDVCVGVCFERSLDLIVTLVAIVKAGGAYVALDPEYPTERLATMISDVGAGLLVVQEKFAEKVGRVVPNAPVPLSRVLDADDDFGALGTTRPTFLILERLGEKIAARPAQAPAVRVALDHLAYVSFTSGSTGRPKGVAVTQRGVVRLVRNTDFASLGAGEIFLQFAPIAFDASTLEIWGPLLNGGRLVVMPAGTPTLDALGRAIREEKITTLWLTAGLFSAMVDEQLDDLRGVRQLLAGGDVLPLPQATRFVRAVPDCRLINGYGPTENTTFTCCHTVTAADLAGASVPIGRPIANTQVHVLDAALQPVPIGVPGELFAGGDGLARGYVGRPDLTLEKFCPNPFGPGRLYRTGDRVRWRADGTIEFLGRLDQQVKIRGYRIEPGEAEAALLAEPGVKAAAVVVREARGRKRLVGYAVGEASAERLRAGLQMRLPDYLVPSVIVKLDALPLNANGKVDRAALPEPEVAATAIPEGSAELRTDAEREIAAIWCGVLGLERVGREDNYFASGGDSIGAIQVASRLKRAGWKVEVRDLFQFPTVAELATHLRRAEAAAAPEEVLSGQIPLTPAQAWFLEHHREDRHHFNQAVLLRPREPLAAEAVAAAVTALWRQHDALRTVLADDRAHVLPPETAPGFSVRELPDEAARLADTETVQAGFDLARGPLFAAVLYRLPTGDRLLLVAHHLVIDGVSWRILLEDLELALRQQAQGRSIDLGARPTSIRRWAEAARARASEPGETWSAGGTAPWPAAQAKSENVFGSAQTLARTLPEATTRALLTTAHAAYHTEINDLLLTALGRALKRWHGGERTRVTLEGHGRDPETGLPGIERTVGWFTCLYPVTLAIAGDDAGAQLKAVKERLRAVPAKGIGYGIERYLNEVRRKKDESGRIGAKKEPGLATEQQAPVSFNYLGQFGEESGGMLAFAEESSGMPIGARVVRMHELDFGAMVARGRMELSLTFGRGRYAAAAMEALLDDWRAEIETLVAHTTARAKDEKTPADFTSRVLTPPAYEALLRARGWEAADVEDVCRLSPMQAGLLFQSLFEKESRAYFVQMAYRLRGRIDTAQLEAAWRRVGRQHAILRTNFVHDGLDEPVQLVWRERRAEIVTTDLRGLAPAEQARAIAAARATDLARGFDLERDALWRVSLWRTADDAIEVVWSYHHLLLDGWSLGLVQRDLLRAYAGEAGPSPVPFRDYIRWLAGRDLASSRKYWAEYLADFGAATPLPVLTKPAADAPFLAADHALELGESLSSGLRALAARAGVTLNTVLQAAWGIVLGRHNRTSDIVFGAIVSGRPAELPGVEEMVGPFICAVPVRVRAAAATRVSSLLDELQRAALAGEAHHHLPIADVQALTPLGRELFDHLLVFENYPVDRGLGESESAWRVEGVEAHDRTHYDLDLTVDPAASVAVKFGYNRSVYADEQIARVAAQLRSVLEQMAAQPEKEIGELTLTTPEEEELVLKTFNATATPAPTEATLLDLLNEAAAKHPDRTAVVHGEVGLTYRELQARANGLAVELQRRGIGPEGLVGLMVDRSVEMIVAVLGVLKAGAAYVPLDPDYPTERLAFMVSDAQPRLIVSSRALAGRVNAIHGEIKGDATSRSRSGDREVAAPRTPSSEREVLIIEDAARVRAAPAIGLRPEHLAYVIYTSGSTGKPKGVMVEHRTLVNAAIAWRAGYGLAAGEVRLLQMASLSFDVFAGDFIRALTNGGLLVVCDGEARLDPAAACDLLVRHRVTLFESTPGLILPLMEHVRARRVALPDLKLLILGSDTLPAREHARLVADFGATMRIVNSYGVTEATIDTCFYEADRIQLTASTAESLDGPAPIGRPMANQQVYVLDERGRVCPVGVAGELLIGGAGVARGYHARPELTAERFVDLELAGRRRRLYRTGDLARWRADGNLEFLGRGDGQVKVRGFRVELGEIEARLKTHPSVRDAIVLARTVDGTTELVAYIVPAGESGRGPADWRAHLLAELPEHMAPAYWVKLERLPLSPNGKIDRRALPAPDADASVRSSAYQAPRDAAEEKLAAIWREVLQATRVGIDDNFFELGGHSLKAMQVVTRVQQAFGVRPGLREFFAEPTIRGLGRLIAKQEAGEPRSAAMAIPPAAPQADYPLSYAQQRLWLLHQLGGEAAYNMPEAYLVESPLDADALEQAFQALIARHEALRTAFAVVNGEPRQRILPTVSFALHRVDLSTAANPEVEAREWADREAAAPFDLAAPPLLRGTLLALGGGRSVFLFTMHHIVGDGWSGNVLYRELFALYAARRRGAPDPLPPLRIQYKDFAVWQKARDFADDEAYWLKQLAGIPEALRLPYDFAPGEDRDFRGDKAPAEIDAATTDALRRLARARRTTLANVLLAVFEALLFQLTKQEDGGVGVSIANRNHPELEHLLGFFVNIVPVRVRVSEATEFDELLAQVVTASEEAFEHQDYPFDLLVQKVNPSRSNNRQPLVNVVYAFQNFADVHVEVEAAPEAGTGAAEALAVRPFEHDFKTSKFDLTLFVADEDGKLALTLEYDTGLFRAETVRKWLAGLKRFAAMVAATAPKT
ncbi:MAG TPA: amino acid adenylation domain-containing protein [Opitutus sp.]|nr:amino acid adenylation domain-containing protein [Opitutus sp.]